MEEQNLFSRPLGSLMKMQVPGPHPKASLKS